MNDKFDCVLSAIEAEHSLQLNEMYRQLELKQNELKEIESSFQKKLGDFEAQMLVDVEARIGKKASCKIQEFELQSEKKIRKLADEKEVLVKRIRHLEHSFKEMEIRNKDLRWKHDELLCLFQNLEQSYWEKMQEFELERKQLISQCKILEEKSIRFEESLHSNQEKHRNQLKQFEKQAQINRKILSREVRKLTKKLAMTKEEKEEFEELVREKEEEVHTSEKQLKEKILSLKKECKNLRREINSCHILASSSASDESSWKEELNRTLKWKEDAMAKARDEMRLRFENDMKLRKDEFERKLQQLVAERDQLRAERDAMNKKLIEQTADCSILRNELSFVHEKVRQNESCKTENETLNSILRSVKEQNIQLKDTIKEMRKDMERMIAGHSSELDEYDTHKLDGSKSNTNSVENKENNIDQSRNEL
jgi:DNA repair exonuclease SbcCD ATPase subunit